jgi:hypothetical protein
LFSSLDDGIGYVVFCRLKRELTFTNDSKQEGFNGSNGRRDADQGGQASDSYPIGAAVPVAILTVPPLAAIGCSLPPTQPLGRGSRGRQRSGLAVGPCRPKPVIQSSRITTAGSKVERTIDEEAAFFQTRHSTSIFRESSNDGLRVSG